MDFVRSSIDPSDGAPWKELVKRFEPFTQGDAYDSESDEEKNEYENKYEKKYEQVDKRIKLLPLQLDSTDKSHYGSVSGNSDIVEGFVDKGQTTSIVTTVLVVCASMICSGLLAVLFYWSYQKEPTLFICIISAITFVYALMNIIYVSVKSKDFDSISFRIYIGTGMSVAIMNIVFIIYFAVKAADRLRAGAGGDRLIQQPF
ncbi:MAG: hypothetical protein EB127_22580 [Alphaproteobacteria bacterium]|nr:hypothetical protein [Alphaproteobacteria bacterium]